MGLIGLNTMFLDGQPFDGWPVKEDWEPRIDLPNGVLLTALLACFVRGHMKVTTIYSLNALILDGFGRVC